MAKLVQLYQHLQPVRPYYGWHHDVWAELSEWQYKGDRLPAFVRLCEPRYPSVWHLPKFGEQGWFLHANNGRVRACNMDKVSVVGERAAPRCSKWTME